MNQALVLQSDFGLSDGAVSAMYGVALKVAPDLKIYDITHDIPPYNVWEASYRLVQTLGYWPEGTVFVSVVDPGVGSNRRSVVAKTKSGHLVVTPDNGTLTHVGAFYGIAEVRRLDETRHRLAGSELSYTFHGRDVYAYTGARLAAGFIGFDAVGEMVAPESLVQLPLVHAQREGDVVSGTIDALDVRFGSLWSNIPYTMFAELNIPYGGRVEVSIRNDTREVYRNTMTYAKSFADVNVGEPLVYINSLLNVAVAINQGSFARAYNIGTGLSWKIAVRRAPKIVYE
ncbi:S-adenosyl-l-methionine hydroxide adenosyltransferase family protein [Gracilinema caldarium]|uniref:SAM hydrolase/SAM-dependent halogenase family protein n=1 Tax=Gracilinema caldarium TaxID=215591 RepID=UPI0026F2EA1B|nr:S-adenosyl-l-methionine hydroxide adenosyltransferase family protein [Gracilinema caldarium]